MQAEVLIATIVDDHVPALADLESDELHTTRAATLAETVGAILEQPPDAVLAVVDEAMAAQVCEMLRALGDVPLLVAARRLSRDARAACLDRGADAVVPLPMAADELRARIYALLRRSAGQWSPTDGQRIRAGDLEIDLERHDAWWRGTPLDLTRTELQVLAVLAETPGRVVTNRELLTRVWGPEYVDDIQYVRLYIRYLRNKLEQDPRDPRIIVNQWGVGYRVAIENSTLARQADASHAPPRRRRESEHR